MKTNVSSKSCVLSRIPRMKRARTCFIVLVVVAICAACAGVYAVLNSAYAAKTVTLDGIVYSLNTSTKKATVTGYNTSDGAGFLQRDCFKVCVNSKKLIQTLSIKQAIGIGWKN